MLSDSVHYMKCHKGDTLGLRKTMTRGLEWLGSRGGLWKDLCAEGLPEGGVLGRGLEGKD